MPQLSPWVYDQNGRRTEAAIKLDLKLVRNTDGPRALLAFLLRVVQWKASGAKGECILSGVAGRVLREALRSRGDDLPRGQWALEFFQYGEDGKAWIYQLLSVEDSPYPKFRKDNLRDLKIQLWWDKRQIDSDSSRVDALLQAWLMEHFPPDASPADEDVPGTSPAAAGTSEPPVREVKRDQGEPSARNLGLTHTLEGPAKTVLASAPAVLDSLRSSSGARDFVRIRIERFVADIAAVWGRLDIPFLELEPQTRDNVDWLYGQLASRPA